MGTARLVPVAFLLLAQAPATDAPPRETVIHIPPASMEAVLGSQVASSDGKAIGRLTDVLVDQDGKPKAAVIDIGGFLGVGTRRVAVDWAALRFSPAEQKNRVSLDMTSDQIRAAPQYQDPTKSVPVVAPPPAAAPSAVGPDKPD
jgi:hypothetical protein